MKLNSFISVILTVACSLMFVACSDWTEPTYYPGYAQRSEGTLQQHS